MPTDHVFRDFCHFIICILLCCIRCHQLPLPDIQCVFILDRRQLHLCIFNTTNDQKFESNKCFHETFDSCFWVNYHIVKTNKSWFACGKNCRWSCHLNHGKIIVWRFEFVFCVLRPHIPFILAQTCLTHRSNKHSVHAYL